MAQLITPPEPVQLADMFQYPGAPYPGITVLLYTDNTIRILDESTNTAVSMKIGDLMFIFKEANGRLQQMRKRIADEKKEAEIAEQREKDNDRNS